MHVRCMRMTFAVALLMSLLRPLQSWATPVQAVQEEGARAGAHQSERHGAAGDSEEHEEQGIVNWWSWDYGPNTKDPSHRGWPPPFGFALINFALFAALIGRFAGPPLKEFLRDRHHHIRHELDEASRLRQEAQAELEHYRQKVESIDKQIEELLSGVRKEAEAEKARLIAAAEAEAARLKADAERQIRVEVDRARLDLRQQVVEAATRIAEDLLRKQTNAEDQRRMAEQFVGGLEQSNLHEKRA